jgi:hypothetical protein
MEASTNNVAGHRAKYELLNASLPKEEVGSVFVGGGDAVLTGYNELELIRKFLPAIVQRVLHISPYTRRHCQKMLSARFPRLLGLWLSDGIAATPSVIVAVFARFVQRVIGWIRLRKDFYTQHALEGWNYSEKPQSSGSSS